MSVVDSLKSRRILGLSLTLVGDQIEDRSHQKKLLVVDGSPESFRGGARESGESSEVDVLGDDEVQPWNDDVTEKLYEWLFEKSWAVQYYIEDGVMNLAIDGNSEEGALKEIRSEKEFRHLKIVIIQPSSGKFTECADHDRGNPEILPEVTSQRTTLVPGTTLRSELGLDAVFSSFVGIAGCEETYGLTVGHMFDEFSKDCSVLSPEGSASKIAECFLRPEIPRLTTDISFMKFLDGVDFNETAILGIRLYTGSAFPKKLSILSSELKDSLDHTQFLKMSLKRHRFTDKLLDKPLHQVMLLDFFSKSTSSEYVCGAPVYFLPTSGNDELEMIGIAIGSYTEEGAGEMVVANYLPEVIRKIQKNQTYMDQLLPDIAGGESRIEVSSTYRIANS